MKKNVLICAAAIVLLTGFTTSCMTMSDEKIAEDIEAGITESGVEDVTVDVTDEGVQLIAGGLNFPPDSAEIISETAAELDKLAMVIAEYSDKQILIEGHTADIGDKASQLSLSKDRAQAVADYLLTKGALTEGSFTIAGIGGAEPISDDNAENRRVEIIILH